MATFLRYVLVHVLMIILIFGEIASFVQADELQSANEATLVITGRDFNAKNDFRNYGCRCQWLKNKLVSFEIASGDYGGEVENVTEKSDCKPDHFGISSSDDAEWECHAFLIEHGTNENQPNRTISLKAKSTSVIRSIIVSPQSTNVSNGDDTTLSCEFSAHAPWCFWTKDDVTIAIEDRYSFVGDKDDGNCSIMIRNVGISDDGSWKCNYPKTSHQDTLQSESSDLLIRVLPTPPVISVNGIGFKNGQKLYISGTLIHHNQYDHIQRRHNYGNDYVSITNGPTLSCWSLNGNPAAKLRWNIDEDNAFNIVRITSSRYPKLHISRIHFPLNDVDKSWQQTNLSCSMDFETSPNDHKLPSTSTSIEIILSVLIEQ